MFVKNLIERKLFCQLFTNRMAKSTFEYVKNFELDDTLLPNTWAVVRLDGKCFHKFADDHNFVKPNDTRALRLMNYTAYKVMQQYHDVMLAYGQSDEYSFIFKKHCNLFNRRSAKLLTTINSTFSSTYVYYWSKFFECDLKYPPSFDGRIITYPSDENLIDYLKWRQADVHINNLYNTTFWNLVLKGRLSPAEAEKKLCGTVSADKNEILFSNFQINYNNEPDIFKRGTILLYRHVEHNDKAYSVIVDVHDDMLKDKFWSLNSGLISEKPSKNRVAHTGQLTDLIQEQLEKKSLSNKIST